jgi:hypothetical protein
MRGHPYDDKCIAKPLPPMSSPQTGTVFLAVFLALGRYRNERIRTYSDENMPIFLANVMK